MIFLFFGWSDFAFWQHQMLQSKPTIQDQVVSTSSFSNQTDRKPVSVFVATNCAELQTLSQPAETHIAQLELSMVLYALVERPDLFPHRQGLWFLDNVAAVMTLVRGRSSNVDLAKLGHLIHLALFALRAQGYWEYVQSKSSWADDISRLGVNDPWWRCHGFNFYSAYLPTILFQLPFVAVILTFEFV